MRRQRPEACESKFKTPRGKTPTMSVDLRAKRCDSALCSTTVICSHSNSLTERFHDMVLDTLNNAARYFVLGERIATALKYLQANDCTKLAVGKIPIQGEQIYALVQDNTTKTRDQGVWEAHRKYIDVQFVAAGVEEMGYANIQTLTVKKPYDEQADYALFEGTGSYVTVPAGSFTIFFLEDGHIPGSAVDGQPAAVRKVVVKVAV